MVCWHIILFVGKWKSEIELKNLSNVTNHFNKTFMYGTENNYFLKVIALDKWDWSFLCFPTEHKVVANHSPTKSVYKFKRKSFLVFCYLMLEWQFQWHMMCLQSWVRWVTLNEEHHATLVAKLHNGTLMYITHPEITDLHKDTFSSRKMKKDRKFV